MTGEFERLFPGLLDEAPASWRRRVPPPPARGCVVLLKGGDTVIADPSGKAAINANAPAWLATAGAGDVLAGLDRRTAGPRDDRLRGRLCGAWLHGDAAARFGPGLIAEDLPEMLPQVLASLQP